MCQSDDLLTLRGSRSVLRHLNSSTGATTGPSSSVLFSLPQEPLGYLVPQSIVLRAQLSVVQAGALNATWAFAGNNGTTQAAAIVDGGCGSASALIQRVTVNLPSGVQCSYPNYSHWVHGILPHAQTAEYWARDQRHFAHAGVVRSNAAANTDASKTAWISIPLDLPCLNSATALPMMLFNSGISIEILTNSITEAFQTTVAGITGYTLSNISLTYQTLQVSPEFKAALVQSVAENGYNCVFRDRMSMGQIGVAAGSVRLNLGVSLSSMTAVLGTFTRAANWGVDTSIARKYDTNGMVAYNVFVNGQQISPPTLTNDASVYQELQRALGRLSDPGVTSALRAIVNTESSAVRNNYCSHQFAFGLSTRSYDDANMALTGIPCDNLQIEAILSGVDDEVAFPGMDTAAAGALHLWITHDSVLTIAADGSCSLRK